MYELAARVESRFGFSKKELTHLFVTVIVAAFILSFRKWGGDEFSLVKGLANLLITVIILFVSFLIHFSAQKLVALKKGYKSEYKYWLNGTLISLGVCFFSYGFFPLFFTGSLWHEVIPKLRMGVFRGGEKHKDLGYIAFAGPLVNIIIVGLVAPIYLATKSPFLYTIIIANLLIGVFSLLPIPTFEKLRHFKGGTTGLYLFIASRWMFVLIFATFIAFAALILLFNVFSYILAFVIGIIMALVYYSQFESEK